MPNSTTTETDISEIEALANIYYASTDSSV